MMDNMLYTYVTTYLFSRLAIMAALGYVVYMTLQPKIALSRMQK
jgi:hypothetical protein